MPLKQKKRNPKIKPPQKRVAQKEETTKLPVKKGKPVMKPVVGNAKIVKKSEKAEAETKPVLGTEPVVESSVAPLVELAEIATVEVEVASVESAVPVVESEVKAKSELAKAKPMRIGILASKNYRADFIAYSEQFLLLNEKFHNEITFVFFGHDLAQDSALGFMKKIDYEFTKPVSIIHYFKQLMALELDLLFIPLINNTYNATSENYNKYLEAGIMEIPILTVAVAPYNKLIQDKVNGFIMQDVGNTVQAIQWLLENRDVLVKAGKVARQDVVKNFNYSQDNRKFIAEVFGIKSEEVPSPKEPPQQMLKEERFFIETLTGCKKETRKVSPNSIFFKKDDMVLFEQDNESKLFWCDYFKFWGILENEFKFNRHEIQSFMNVMMRKHLNLDGFTVKEGYLTPNIPV